MFEIFEVFNINNERVFYTNDKKCVPSKKEMETLIGDGHKVKLNNKTLYKKNIADFLNSLK